MHSSIRKLIDLIVTLVLWVYFIFGFLILFLPRYLVALRPVAERELCFQRLNHLFFRRFFQLTRILIPALGLRIDDRVTAIRSSIIVCNHVSYLDPLLLISLFEKQKTIVKSGFFRAPVFGWLMKQSGYVPAVGSGVSAWQVLGSILHLGDYLATGGNIFVFPEGTRSRTGKIGALSGGVFEIATRSRAPIQVLFIENTDRLFRPGRFLLNSAINRPVRLRLLDTLNPDYTAADYSVDGLMAIVKTLLDHANNREDVNDDNPEFKN